MTIRHRVIACVLLSLVCVSLLGQAAEPWTQWVEHEHEVHVGTVLDMGGEYWLIGTSIASLDPPNAGIVVFRIQPNGTPLYSSSYDWEGVQAAADALATPEGGILFAGRTDTYGAVGSDMYVLHTDASGQTLGEWVFGGPLEESATCIVLGSQGDYFVVGNQTDPNDVIADPDAPGYGGLEGRTAPYVVRIDSSGAPLWKKDYPSEDNIVVFDAVPSRTGGCYVLSTVYGFPNDEDTIRLDRLDGNGLIMWSRTFGDKNSKGYTLLPLPTGRLLIAGAQADESTGHLQALLVLVEEFGQQVWSHVYGDAAQITTAHELIATDDGLIVAVGTQFADYALYRDDVYVFCVDGDGELQWEESYATGKHVMIEALRAASDGGFLIAGTGAAAGDPFQAMLMYVNPLEAPEGL